MDPTDVYEAYQHWDEAEVLAAIRGAARLLGRKALAPGAASNSVAQRATPAGHRLHRAYHAVVRNQSIPTLPDWPTALRKAGFEPSNIYETLHGDWTEDDVITVVQDAAAILGANALAPGAVISKSQRACPIGLSVYRAYRAVVTGSIPTLPNWPTALSKAGLDPKAVYRNYVDALEVEPRVSVHRTLERTLLAGGLEETARTKAVDAALKPLFEPIRPAVIRATKGPMVVFVLPRLLKPSTSRSSEFGAIEVKIRQVSGVEVVVTTDRAVVVERELAQTPVFRILGGISSGPRGAWGIFLTHRARRPVPLAALVPLIVRGLSQHPRTMEFADATPYLGLKMTLPEALDALDRYL